MSIIKTHKENAYHLIRSRLLSRQLTLGGRLSELALAKELNISRTPIREAVGQLVHEGFLEQFPNEGTFVRRPDRAELEDLYELREWVESGAAAKAAKYIDQEHASELEKFCAESHAIARAMREADSDQEIQRLLKLSTAVDLKFHITLIRISGNRRAMKVVGDNHILSQAWSALPSCSFDLRVVAWVYRDHARILRCVRRGDAEGAGRAMKLHIERGRRHVLRWFDLGRRREAAGARAVAYWPNSALETVRTMEDSISKDDGSGHRESEAETEHKPSPGE